MQISHYSGNYSGVANPFDFAQDVLRTGLGDWSEAEIVSKLRPEAPPELVEGGAVSPPYILRFTWFLSLCC